MLGVQCWGESRKQATEGKKINMQESKLNKGKEHSKEKLRVEKEGVWKDLQQNK